MLYALLKTLHVLAIMVWVGGMVFVHFFLRPALGVLEPPQRLKLMHAVLGRFFAAVGVAAALALATGAWMMLRMARYLRQAEASAALPIDWTVMAVLGVLMIGIFGYIRFVLYKRLAAAVSAGDWPVAGAALGAIRPWVSVNLALGLLIVVVVLMY